MKYLKFSHEFLESNRGLFKSSCQYFRDGRDLFRSVIFFAPNFGLDPSIIKINSLMLSIMSVLNTMAEYFSTSEYKDVMNLETKLRIYEPLLEGISNCIFLNVLNSQVSLDFDTNNDFKKIIACFSLCLILQAKLHYPNKNVLPLYNPHYAGPLLALLSNWTSRSLKLEPLQTISRMTIGMFSFVRASNGFVNLSKNLVGLTPTSRL